MPKHPLTCFRFKVAKTTIFLPVTPSSTLASLRKTLLSALEFSSTENASPEMEFADLVLPKSASDIALWRLEPSTKEEEVEGAEENWVRMSDEKSTADKLGLREAEEVGVSFIGSDGKFPKPSVVRPRDDEYEEGMEEEA